MESRKIRWWMLVILVLLVVTICLVVFRDVIFIHVAPKAVLTAALKDTYSQLQERFREDPLMAVIRNLDPDGKYTAEVHMNASNNLLGDVSYDMLVQTNAKKHQLYAEGSAATSSRQLDLSWYMDEVFFCVSSDGMVGGNCYGITYDTFSEDIRSIPMLSFFISNKLLTQWDDAIQNIQEQMLRSYTIPQISDISDEDLQKLLLGVLAYPCEIEKASIADEDTFLECYALSYCASGEQFNSMVPNTAIDEDASLTMTFYLYENVLVKIQFQYVSAGQSDLYSLNLGLDPLENTLSLQRIENEDGVFETFELSVETERTTDQYNETWCLSKTANGAEENVEIGFDYWISNGAMELRKNDAESVQLSFIETENGFRLETDHFEKLMEIFSEENTLTSQEKSISGIMMVTQGSQIVTPEYKNLNQWSLEDFWTLLSGVGSLIGIQIES